MRESKESISASIAQSFAPSLLRQLCESLRFTANSVFVHRSECTPSCIALSPRVSIVLTRESVRFRNSLAFACKNIMTMGERHEHMSTPSAFEEVNGVNLNLRFVVQSFP